MANQPNLSREGLQKLEFVGRQGDQLVYQGPNQKMIMLDVETVNRLGMPVRSRKRNRHSKYSEEDIWSGSKTSQTQDRLATAKLLEILKGYQVQGELFTNKRMRKRELWTEVASQMMDAGFSFRSKETAWEKVSQKWRNMERTYRMHINNIRNKGHTESSRSLEFFDDLHELLAGKYNTELVLSDSGHDMSYQSHNESETLILDMMNEELDYEEEQEEETAEEQSIVTAELGPDLQQPDVCYDTYIEDELPPSPTFSDNKNLVFAQCQETSTVQDPVILLLLEMRAQERAHFREDRRERLKIQRETLEFRRSLIDLLNQQHQERMQVMHSLISAISGALTASSSPQGPSLLTGDKFHQHLSNGDLSVEDTSSFSPSRHANQLS